MNTLVARYTLRNNWLGLLWYLVGNLGLLGIGMLVAKGKQASLEAAMASGAEAFPSAVLKSLQIDVATFSTPIGYISSAMLSLMWPLILVALVAGSASAISAMVEDGTIHFDLSLRIPRLAWLLGRFAASVASLLIFVLVSVGVLSLLAPAAWWRFGVLGFAFGFLALAFSYAVAVATNTRTRVLSVVFIVFVAEWMLTTLSEASNWAWAGWLSVYGAYRPEAAVTQGLDWGAVLLWLGLGVAFLAFALWRWRTRDIPA